MIKLLIKTEVIKEGHVCMLKQLSGLVVRVSALRLGGWGSIPGSSLGPHGLVRLTYLLYVCMFGIVTAKINNISVFLY